MYDESRDYLKYPTFGPLPRGLPVPGSHDEEFRRANALYDQGAYAEAFVIYSKLARQGHARAQYNLAICYRDGSGVKQDHAQKILVLVKYLGHDRQSAGAQPQSLPPGVVLRAANPESNDCRGQSHHNS